MLERLERRNLFVVPLDDDRRWYRYHHLFADLLQARLHQSGPDPVARLLSRAAEWCERDGQVAEAVGYALAAKDYGRAAGLIARYWGHVGEQRRDRDRVVLAGCPAGGRGQEQRAAQRRLLLGALAQGPDRPRSRRTWWMRSARWASWLCRRGPARMTRSMRPLPAQLAALRSIVARYQQ